MSVTFQPGLWYAVTAKDDNEACENYDQEFVVDPCYSNGGLVVIKCGLCRVPMTLVSATLLDPQPQMP
jgi:hypothetical protein